MKFGELIQAFRSTYRHGRTQLEITAQAVTYKRQLESVGMFPGLQPGTPARPSARPDRAARKAKAREIAKQRHYHLAAGGKLSDFVYHEPGEFMKEPADRCEAISDADHAVIEEVMAAPLPIYDLSDGPRHFVAQDVDDGQFRVFNPRGEKVAGPYPERKTANRRAKQLNEKAAA